MPKALTMEEKIEKANARVAVRNETERPTRTKRGTFNGTEGKLRINHQIDGFHLHIFNDSPGRIEQAMGVGYEFVSPDEVGGTSTNVVSRNTDLGDKVRYLVGVDAQNEPQYAYLMKIRQELYDEDQAVLQARNDQIDAAIRGGKATKEGHNSEGFYTPQGGIKLERG
jgi:hypothetical protein